MAKTSALNEEMRRKAQGTSTHSEVLVTKRKGRSQRELKGGRDKSRSKSRSRYKNIECHYCHKIGHIQRNCFLWKKESKVWTRVFRRASSLDGRDSLFDVLLENHLKKKVWSHHLFLFYFKREKQNKKEKP